MGNGMIYRSALIAVGILAKYTMLLLFPAVGLLLLTEPLVAEPVRLPLAGLPVRLPGTAHLPRSD